jgi:hypothetical protein
MEKKLIKMNYHGGFPFTEVPGYGKFFKKEKDGRTSGMFDIKTAQMLNHTPEWSPDDPADLKPPVIEKKSKKAVTDAK